MYRYRIFIYIYIYVYICIVAYWPVLPPLYPEMTGFMYHPVLEDADCVDIRPELDESGHDRYCSLAAITNAKAQWGHSQ